jgi:menaquinone-9 beta-reductase
MSETAPEADRAEAADVVVIGARCAGSAVASMLASSGRRVIVLDRTRFPSDTLSTHAMFPSGCAEMRRIGVWERVLDEIDPARLDRVQLTLADGTEVRERWEPVDGIDFGVSIPRDQLDVVLASNAAERGADLREGCTVTEVIWSAGRASGVVYRDPESAERRIRAKLVIGADGRRR